MRRLLTWIQRDRGPFSRIEVVSGDITRLRVDAIVNAANSALAGGSGVDGAIHRAAGPELLKECSTLGGCPTGSAVATDAYELPARWVIHAVGPIWEDGHHGEPELLRGAYTTSLEVARELGARTVAFPAISCGVYGYPLRAAAEIAVAAVAGFLAANDLPERATLCCFGARVEAETRRALEARGARP